MAGIGSLLGRANGSPVKTVAVEVSSTGNDLVAGTAGKKIKVLGWVIAGTGTNPTIKFEDGATDYTGDMNLTGGPSIAPMSELGWFTLPAGLGLDYTITGTTPSLDGVLTYILVD